MLVESGQQLGRKLEPTGDECGVFDVGGGCESEPGVGKGVEQSLVVVACKFCSEPGLQ